MQLWLQGEATVGYLFRALTGRSGLQKVLRKHFHGLSLSNIVTAAREFPITSRVDVQTALEQLFAARPDTKLLGIHSQMQQETPTLAHLFSGGPFPIDLGPLQHDEVDIGDPMPVRCLKNALWLRARRLKREAAEGTGRRRALVQQQIAATAAKPKLGSSGLR